MSHINDVDGRFSMSKAHRAILAKSRVYLSRNLQLREVVDELVSVGVINQHTEELIFASNVPSERTRAFLMNLPKLGPTAFDKFLVALRVTHQSDIIDYLTSAGDVQTSASGANGEIFNFISQEESPMPVARENIGSSDMSKDGATTMDYRTLDYDLQKSENVQVLIINNENFETTELDRQGSSVDVENLENLFCNILKFTVTSHHNLTGNGMRSVIKSFSESECLSAAEACIVVIMTHGSQGFVYGRDKINVSIDEIVSYFLPDYCGKLKNKPKYFIFQSCRGDRKEVGYDATDSEGGEEGASGQIFHGIQHDTESKKSNTIPLLSDTLISYATISGHVAWRNSKKGSWFIESLCKIFSEQANNVDVLSMLTMVTDEIIKNYGESYKQLCESQVRLRKRFFLTPRR